MTDISLILPARNAARTLGDCLDALYGQDLPRSQFEIIVIDNGSTDETAAIAKRYADTRLLSEPERGAYLARNRGIAIARGRLMAFIDADCVPRPDWLSHLRQTMENPRIQVVMGRDLPGGETTAVRLLGDYDHFKEMFVMSSSCQEIYYGHTNCLMTRRHTVDEVGLFDGRPRGADVIFVQRVIERYGTDAVVYRPDAVVDHTEIQSALVYLKKAFIYGRSARSYARVVSARPLRNAERLRIFLQVKRGCGLSSGHASYLLLLLVMGVSCYGAGWLSLLREPRP